jgi:hypothetical protein
MMLVCNKCGKEEYNMELLHEECSGWFCTGRFISLNLIGLDTQSIEDEFENVVIPGNFQAASAPAKPPSAAAAGAFAAGAAPPRPLVRADPTTHFFNSVKARRCMTEGCQENASAYMRLEPNRVLEKSLDQTSYYCGICISRHVGAAPSSQNKI